jgi:hypothetical protein
MSTTRRGISLHAMAETCETLAMGLRPLDLRGQHDRVLYVITLMLSDDRVTKEQAIEAADRYHPLKPAERPASEPGSPAHEPEPSRQA